MPASGSRASGRVGLLEEVVMSTRRPARGRLPEAKEYRPQLATLVKEPPEGDAWFHEVKFDGYRIGCRIDGRKVTLVSRNGKDWTSSFPEVVKAATVLGAREALLDGEVAIVQSDGRTSFHALQNALGGGSRAGLTYFVFDLLFLDGADLCGLPLEERKSELA